MAMRQPAVSTLWEGRSYRALSSWNVAVTAKDHEQRHLARCVKRPGDFWWTPFLGLLVGRVEDHEASASSYAVAKRSGPGFSAPWQG